MKIEIANTSREQIAKKGILTLSVVLWSIHYCRNCAQHVSNLFRVLAVDIACRDATNRKSGD
jgi:hypothetical protein